MTQSAFPPDTGARRRLPLAVFFDAVFTLFDFDPSFPGAFARVAADFGHAPAPGQVEEILRRRFAEAEREARARAIYTCSAPEMSREWIEFDTEVFRELGFDGDARRMAVELEERFDSGRLTRLYPGVFETLRGIRGAGFATGIISNGTAGMKTCLDAMGLTAEVDVTIVSALAGWEKPAREIFRLAEEAVGLPPERCLFVGDTFWRDVEGASAAGWRAIWLNAAGRPAPAPSEQNASLAALPPLVRAWAEEHEVAAANPGQDA